MKIVISGRGVELTEAIKDYVQKKFGGLEKFFACIARADVTIGMENHHHQKGEIFFAECKLAVPGNDVFDKKTAGSVYAAVDLLHDYLAAELKKHKAKLRGNEKKQKTARRNNKEYNPE